MAVLLEVHDERELDIALSAQPQIIGINNRNLVDMSIDRQTTHRLCEIVPPEVLVVSASGLTDQLRKRPSEGR